MTETNRSFRRFTNPEYTENVYGKVIKNTTVGVRKGQGIVFRLRTVQSHLEGPDHVVRKPFYRTRVALAKLDMMVQEKVLTHQKRPMPF